MRNERSRGNEYCPIDDSTAGQSTGLENTTQNPRHTAPEGSTQPSHRSEQFPAKTPKHHTTTRYDEIIVADDDAILFELESDPAPGDPDA
ncbi:hypothetical protein [Halostagnicola sp. A-GB9-2]|uniref:hypothetical protein n=1 Tax=Halostagnicola sp. A-GB9-2 TaxID=3048066 RepID=UPI0024C0CA0C|nr:hypothetical protein [Halostagnicola sp. A-GB9-2]MDJ1434726.1 hypothetical protein [Halostagnicola sp. A-GB9-2]